MKYKKYLLFFLAIFTFIFVSFAEENNDADEIEGVFSRMNPEPPPPPPPLPPEHLSLFYQIKDKNEITELDSVIVLKNTDTVEIVCFLSQRRVQEQRQAIRESSFCCPIDTVRVNNKIYYYRQNHRGESRLIRAERFNSQNLLIESIRFGRDSLAVEKTFFEYDESGLLLSERKYIFPFVDEEFRSDSVLIIKDLHRYENGRLVVRNHVRIFNPGRNQRLTNQYYNELGKIIKVEVFSVDEYGDIVWKSIRDFKYNEKGNIEKFAHYTSFDDTVINEKFTFKYVDNRIITYKSVDNQPKERHYEFILK